MPIPLRVLLLIGALLLLPFALPAQTAQPPQFTGITVGVMATDYEFLNGNNDAFRPVATLEVGLRRQLGDRLALLLPVRYGFVDVGEFVNYRQLSGDLLLRWYPKGFTKRSNFYLQGGAALATENSELENYTQFPIGVGVDFPSGKNTWFGLRAEYRATATPGRQALSLGAAVTYRFGVIDTDGDRVPDLRDRCPEVAGSRTARGCPDRDRDRVRDAYDDCPDVPGHPRDRGCPDTDDDGILDHLDLCPNVPGEKATNGCPDTDADGVPDHLDVCPTLRGPAATNGCPDRDQDGIYDAEDQCPDVPGPATSRGCPDRDNDGVFDAEDQCPDRPGPKRFRGCPDRDLDGLPDDLDRCPDLPGDLRTGCPDRDQDGFPDHEDKCPDRPGKFSGCPDTDRDGTPDHLDQCPKEFGPARLKGCPEE